MLRIALVTRERRWLAECPGPGDARVIGGWLARMPRAS
jgi:hypothetical protein